MPPRLLRTQHIQKAAGAVAPARYSSAAVLDDVQKDWLQIFDCRGFCNLIFKSFASGDCHRFLKAALFLISYFLSAGFHFYSLNRNRQHSPFLAALLPVH